MIPAKGHSTRLPGKNMSLLHGRPIIGYTIDEARRSRRVYRIVCSTDSDAIEAYARTERLEVVRRPGSLGGEVPLFDVYQHAATAIGLDTIDILIGLQPDHPDRTVRVDQALGVFEAVEADLLYSTDRDGTANGSYKIYSPRMLLSGRAERTVAIVDDCTNVHTSEDLERASSRIRPSSA